jgi:signal transduction histidine kinase
MAFGLVLGITVGLYGLRTAAEQRAEAMQQVTSAVAASLMPLIADQDREHLDAQVKSILRLAGSNEIGCIRVEDATGNTIASSSDSTDCCSAVNEPGVIAMFSSTQVVSERVEVSGLTVARVYLEFEPPGMSRALVSPLLAAALVVFSVMLVSVPWTAWLFTRNVSEPLSDLRDGATALAQGKRDRLLSTGRTDEIGDLAVALDDMAEQITAQEERLRESRDTIEAALRMESRAKTELQTLAKMKSDFVAVASHEIRAPLAVIRTYAELLEGGELGRLGVKAKDAVEAIVASASRLTLVVSDLMDAALLERGLMPLEFAEVPMAPLLRRAVRESDAMSHARGVSVTLAEPVPDVSIRADALRLRQVLDNLISNAVKYSDGADSVEVRLSLDDHDLRIDVIDMGIGIPSDRHAQLFRLFGRLDVDDSRQTAGLGIGLAISARIAEAHGGVIECTDNPAGRGTVFILKLPLDGPGRSRERSDVTVVERGAEVSGQ